MVQGEIVSTFQGPVACWDDYALLESVASLISFQPSLGHYICRLLLLLMFNYSPCISGVLGWLLIDGDGRNPLRAYWFTEDNFMLPC